MGPAGRARRIRTGAATRSAVRRRLAVVRRLWARADAPFRRSTRAARARAGDRSGVAALQRYVWVRADAGRPTRPGGRHSAPIARSRPARDDALLSRERADRAG